MLLSVLGLAVKFGDVAFKIERVEAAGKVGFGFFDVIVTTVIASFDDLLSIPALLSLQMKFKVKLYQSILPYQVPCHVHRDLLYRLGLHDLHGGILRHHGDLLRLGHSLLSLKLKK